jgi:MFS family permease
MENNPLPDYDFGLSSTNIIVDIRQSTRLWMGLSGNLWRLAGVAGIAQFSMSLWAWQFGIFLAGVVEKWQIGLTFSIGTFAMIIGYGVSGTVADFIGRKNALIFSFVPMCAGLLALRFFPIWPLIPLEYGVTSFGWAFVIIMSRAMPADEIAQTDGQNSARIFNMTLLPAFLVDGISPIVAALLLDAGYVAGDLHLLAALGALVAIVATSRIVKESLGRDLMQKAKAGPMITFRGLGRNFWIFTSGMFGFVFIGNLAFPYLGNLVVGEWGLNESTYGFAWAAYSFTSVILMYNVSSLTDKNVRVALVLAIWSTAVILGLFALGSGVLELIILNIIWAAPLVVWTGAENSLAVNGVTDEMKGRALGTYQLLMSSTRLFGSFVGAILWDYFGSLRTVFSIASIGGLIMVIGLTYAIMSIKIERKSRETVVLGKTE